jgi:Amt family ammonium transporter
VVFAVLFFDKLKIDDPVGAVSVHGVCGAWGTLAIGLFGKEVGLIYGGGVTQLGIQALGVGSAFIWSFGVSMVIFLSIKYTIGLRVSAEEEMEGLDVTEHGMHAYPPAIVNPAPAPTGSMTGSAVFSSQPVAVGGTVGAGV